MRQPARQVYVLEKMLHHDLDRITDEPFKGYPAHSDNFLILDRAMKLAQLIADLNDIEWHSYDGWEEEELVTECHELKLEEDYKKKMVASGKK